jgi:hypothetical protein
MNDDQRQWRELSNEELFRRDELLESAQNEANQAKLNNDEDDRLCNHVAFCVRDGYVTGLTEAKSGNK